MRKKDIRRWLSGTMMISLLALSGCQAVPTQTPVTEAAEAEELDVFAGGGVEFSYDPQAWRVSAKERMSGDSLISVFNQENNALVTMAAYQKGDATEIGLFDYVREKDADAGIMDEKTGGTTLLGVKNHTLSYWVEDETQPEGKRYVYAAVLRFKESEMVAVLAEYYQEDDLDGIEDLIDTIDRSVTKQVDGVLGTLSKDLHLGRIIDNYLYYTNGEYEIRQAEIYDKIDSTFYEKTGYEYIYEVEMADARANIYPVLFPKVSDYDGTYFSYYEHGFYLWASIEEFDRTGQSAAQYLETVVKADVDRYQESPRDYTNLVENPIVANDNQAYQVIQVDVVESDKSVTTEETLYYVQKLSEDVVLSWSLELIPYNIVGISQPLLEELLRAYDIAAGAVEFDAPELTFGGGVVDPDQNLYEGYYDEYEVNPVDGYPLMGQTTLEEGDVEVEIYIPRGSNTSTWGYAASFNMYGLTGTIMVDDWGYYYYDDLQECAEDYITDIYEEHTGYYAKYYTDQGEIKYVSGLAGNMTAAFFSEYAVDTDNSQYLAYQIVLCKDLGGEGILVTELELETQNASGETNELLTQYGELLGIDFYDLMDREDENPLRKEGVTDLI